MADHASARKAWEENDSAEREGRWAPSIGHASKWHEAVALWVRALELEPTNAKASYHLYDTILHNGHAKANLPRHILNHQAPVLGASFSQNGERARTASVDGAVFTWDLSKDPPVGERLTYFGDFKIASVSPDGARVLTGKKIAGDFTASVWDISTKTRKMLRHTDTPVIGASY